MILDNIISGSAYNFIETVPAASETTALESLTVLGKTMRHSGIAGQEPDVSVNGTPLVVTKTVGDENVYTFSFLATLDVGANSFTIVSNNGVSLTKTLVLTRTAIAPSCILTHDQYLKAGEHTITMTTDYNLLVAPTLEAVYV